MLAVLLIWLVYRIRLQVVTTRLRALLAERLSERERIAAELHDTLLQSVQGLILLFSGVAAQLPAESPVSNRVESAIQRAEHLLEEGRDSVRDLRRRHIDLAECFQRLEEELVDTNTRYIFALEGEQPELQPSVGDEVYKLGREAVRNGRQHACARTVEVRLAFLPHALQLTVRDDGRGMSEELLRSGRTGHWGLQGMVERARNLNGHMLLRSKVGHGTTVRLSLGASVAYRNARTTLRGALESYRQRLLEWMGE